MKQKITLRYKGWFGLCPVYIDDPNLEAPFLEPRYPFTGWLLGLSTWIYDVLPDGRGYPIHVSGKLEAPIVLEFEEA